MYLKVNVTKEYLLTAVDAVALGKQGSAVIKSLSAKVASIFLAYIPIYVFNPLDLITKDVHLAL